VPIFRTVSLRVVSAILFSPRGGSAHVARALVRGLRARGCSVTLLAGSRRDLGRHGDARSFYGDVEAVDFDPALASGAPLRYEGPAGTAPLHPSFEERAGAPDRVFAMLDDLDFERQVRAWSKELSRARAAEADVLHLHHLTPLNEAAARVAPEVPVASQLHGTELLMLERIDAGAPPAWVEAERWAERLRAWARRCALIVVAPAGIERARRLLDISSERVISLPNGVDVDEFSPRELDRESFWREVLVERPQGWQPGGPPGSIRYEQAEVAELAAGVVLLYVGRFTAVKRLDQLLAAFAMAKTKLNVPASLVLVGGHPGEWEGEHPAEIVARRRIPSVFLAGWQSHDRLPLFFAAGDAVVMTSEREQFGLLLVEGMACARPAVATHSLGPGSIIEDGRTGWLVGIGDLEGFAAAMVEVVERRDERERRGHLARLEVRERYSWLGIAATLESLFEEVVRAPARRPAVEA
jgi:glycosyltransferase involved in cell wall biosynthesis